MNKEEFFKFIKIFDREKIKAYNEYSKKLATIYEEEQKIRNKYFKDEE